MGVFMTDRDLRILETVMSKWEEKAKDDHLVEIVFQMVKQLKDSCCERPSSIRNIIFGLRDLSNVAQSIMMDIETEDKKTFSRRFLP